jgi:hypothetical protein
MNNKREIKEEQEAMAREFPLLFSLEKKNPFSTPDSYFEDAESTILLRVNVISEKSGLLPDEVEDLAVPENYFEELESKIKNAVKLDELKQQSFTTPENYFGEFEETLKTNLFLDQLNKNSFEVPAGYFEDSAAQLHTFVRLAQLRNETVFSVPENYFETFEARLREKLAEKKEAKVIKLYTASRALKYFAAAAVLAAICFGSYVLFTTAKVSGLDSAQLSALDKRKVIENPSEFGIDEDAVVEMLQQNPELLAGDAEPATELTDEAMNEIVLDKDIDVNTIIGED